MRHREDDRTLRRWIEAERQQRSEEADRELTRLFRAVPRLSPAPGFADRVLVAAGVRRAQPWWYPSRALVVTSLAAAAVTLATVVPVATVFVLSRVGAIVSLVTRVTTAAADWLGLGLRVWTVLENTGEALAVVVVTPQFATVLVLNLFVAAAALHGLNRLLASGQRYSS